MSDLPEGWTNRSLGECLITLRSTKKKVERGWSPQCLAHPVSSGNAWGVLKTTAVQMGEFQSIHHKELPSALDPRTELEVQAGDFLMTTTGPRSRCGVVCFVDSTPQRLIFSGKILRFRANREVVDPRWLKLVLISPGVQRTLDELKVGTSDSSVSIGNEQVLGLQIPLPPLPTQHRVVEALDHHLSRLDAALAGMAQAKAQSESLLRSWLHLQFSESYETGAVGLLGQLAETRLGKMLDAARNEGELTPYLRNANVQWESIQIDDISQARMTEKDRTELALVDGDVLVCEGGVPGRSAVWSTHMLGHGIIGYQKALHRVRPGGALTSQFLVMVLRYLSLTGLLDRFTTGTTIKHLPQEQLRQLLIPALTIESQTKLISEYQRLQALVTHASSTVEALEHQITELRRSLLHAASTGRLIDEDQIE